MIIDRIINNPNVLHHFPRIRYIDLLKAGKKPVFSKARMTKTSEMLMAK
jgi:hypothetical protein